MQGLHDAGLRVVQDVVYNHTFASGLDRYSVLDKIVPGYYHRRTESGKVCDSTCCNNTATEHLMAERLMIDDLVHWATHYRINGFRCYTSSLYRNWFFFLFKQMCQSSVVGETVCLASCPETDQVHRMPTQWTGS